MSWPICCTWLLCTLPWAILLTKPISGCAEESLLPWPICYKTTNQWFCWRMMLMFIVMADLLLHQFLHTTIVTPPIPAHHHCHSVADCWHIYCHGRFVTPPIPAHHHCHSVADCWHTVHCTFFILGMSWPIFCTWLHTVHCTVFILGMSWPICCTWLHTVHCTFFILGMSWPIYCAWLLHTAMGHSHCHGQFHQFLHTTIVTQLLIVDTQYTAHFLF